MPENEICIIARNIRYVSIQLKSDTGKVVLKNYQVTSIFIQKVQF